MVDVPIGTAALIVVLGMAVVFFGLILLMYVTKITGKIMQSREKKKADVHTGSTCGSPRSSEAAARAAPARSSCTTYRIRRRRCSWRSWPTSSGKPLNELRFISIREIRIDP